VPIIPLGSTERSSSLLRRRARALILRAAQSISGSSTKQQHTNAAAKIAKLAPVDSRSECSAVTAACVEVPLGLVSSLDVMLVVGGAKIVSLHVSATTTKPPCTATNMRSPPVASSNELAPATACSTGDDVINIQWSVSLYRHSKCSEPLVVST
jgi:hypothetical protein